MTVPDDSYWTFVREMNERANQGAYDPKKPLFELIRRARQGDRDAEAMLKTQQSRWDGKFPTYTDEELGINAQDAS